ncbi:carboxypeptidase-like regulatory domain-containing protein, partial [Dyadobacter sp.]|uniref:carboxypeptidase-like regulatory domain-containing protein n=1 Tax=Dyadobacter sp. TaxID=1914288 RepID=UPI003F728E54
MKTISRFLIILLLTNRLFAQAPLNSISGTVKDIHNEVLPGVTVRVVRVPDSVFVKGEITNVEGKFQVNALENGTYLLAISALGQKAFTSLPMTLDSAHKSVVLPVIILLPAKNIELKEVTVKAKKPLIEHEID